MKRFGLILAVFALLSPLGLYLTDAPAWGEWDFSYYKEHLGFVPKKMLEATQHAPIADYSLEGVHEVTSYYMSAFVGVVMIFGFFFLLRRFIKDA